MIMVYEVDDDISMRTARRWWRTRCFVYCVSGMDMQEDRHDGHLWSINDPESSKSVISWSPLDEESYADLRMRMMVNVDDSDECHWFMPKMSMKNRKLLMLKLMLNIPMSMAMMMLLVPLIRTGGLGVPTSGSHDCLEHWAPLTFVTLMELLPLQHFPALLHSVSFPRSWIGSDVGSSVAQSCKMSQIWQIYLCKNIEKLG